jgi:pimeloyl-ACP methyl ester carboxylesterase
MSLFADDLVKMLDALEIPQVIACGLSMGGYILLDALSRYPERFAGVVLSDTQCIADSAEAREKRYKTIESIQTAGTGDFATGFVKNIFCDESHQNKKDLINRIDGVVRSASAASVMATLYALAHRFERCSDLGNISVPALIVCGREDKITPVAQSEFMHANIPSSAMVIIESAGHVSNLEQPEIFNRHLQDFISRFIK